MRHIKRELKIGNTAIGGSNPVLVQSMLNVKSSDVEGNVRQAVELEKAGCQIVRVSVPTLEDVRLVEAIKNEITIPLVADIHFDYKIALACADAGIDKIRINPGNIGDDEKVKAVVKACSAKNIPIRIGVNAGSLEKNILARYGKPSPEALCESAMYHIGLLERFDFNDIAVSIKSSNVKNMIEAYTLLDSKCNYPLHLGVTEAGTYRMGIIKSAMGIGSLLMNGIGDTIRVSLTDAPVREIDAGFDILRAAGHKVNGPEIISCPTCGRTRLDVAAIANEVV
ncbi:MAG: flavodoxin-dependent (E)-4-hydroxy-3-methylbut-2-enyl-diphosphate synthase, partial [Oscillospiraceae bacterium]|nr:flavodoxin-dependent (E)-4-hydroxy-3-methylbut-2-enyl-diphosphate synthase [Oscillospiraceae bacterium]